jgi:hypothetical protein
MLCQNDEITQLKNGGNIDKAQSKIDFLTENSEFYDSEIEPSFLIKNDRTGKSLRY